MKKRLVSGGIGIAVLLSMSGWGCASAPAQMAPGAYEAEYRKLLQENTEEIAVGNNILQSIQKDDYTLFQKNVPVEFAKTMNEEKFHAAYRNIEGQFGKLQSYAFLSSLITPSVKNLLWQVTFVRRSHDNKEIRQQMLFRLVSGTLDGKVQVISFGFF